MFEVKRFRILPRLGFLGIVAIFVGKDRKFMNPSSHHGSSPPPEKGRRAFHMTGPVIVALLLCLLAILLPRNAARPPRSSDNETPSQPLNPLEELLLRRRSVREYGKRRLSREELRRLCWAAQGITETRRGLRAAPSAGALYPLALYVATPEGVLRYRPETDRFSEHLAGDLRNDLAQAALQQESVASAPAVFVIAANVSVTESRYGERAERYVWMEVGHTAQNLLLQAVALNLAGVPIGAFNDEKIGSILKLPEAWRPCYLVPIGEEPPGISAPDSSR